MNKHISSKINFAKIKSDCIVVGIFEGGLGVIAKEADELAKGLITRLIKNGDFTAKAGSTHLLHEIVGISSPRLMLVGLGKLAKDIKEDNNANKVVNKNYKKACLGVGKELKEAKYKKIALSLSQDFSSEYPEMADWAVNQAIVNIERAMNVYPANRKKVDKKIETKTTKTLTWLSDNKAKLDVAINQGEAIAWGMEKMLLVANHPANQCTPSAFAKFAKGWVSEIIKNEKSAVTIKVLGEKEIRKLNMNCFLSVAQGSEQEPKLVEIVYKGSKYVKSSSKKANKPIALVGKGVTFDSGGISLKPGGEMDHMKWDMCGAASVLGTVLACAKMKLPLDVVAVIPLTENMPSSKAVKPSDVVTTMSGLTVENLNTDAEGRLVLCDAITYTQKFHKPEVLIDVATLTGACVVALGSLRSGLVANDDKLAEEILSAADKALDPSWLMPYDTDYLEGMKSNFADLANISGRGAGTITGAMFLSKFIEKNVLWGHLDIAGVAYNGNGANKGATGRPIPLLIQYLMQKAGK